MLPFINCEPEESSSALSLSSKIELTIACRQAILGQHPSLQMHVDKGSMRQHEA